MPPVLAELLAALGEFPLAAALRGPGYAYAFVSAAHILGIGLLIGNIAALDLRLLGAFPAVPVAAIAPMLSRLAALGLALAVAMGLLLFMVRPLHYAANPAFLAKLALIGAGVVNALALRATAAWRLALATGTVRPVLKAASALSLALWLAAVLAGRLIAFVG